MADRSVRRGIAAPAQRLTTAEPWLIKSPASSSEETLRLESPLHGHFRVVRHDTEIAGKPLPQGSRVMLLWGAPNRDGNEFPNPDTIDLACPYGRSHLAFGFGIHHCLGAAAMGRSSTSRACSCAASRRCRSSSRPACLDSAPRYRP
jgi:cytochrome P450